MAQDQEPVKAGGVIQIDERPIRDHVDQVVRATVEETLNQLLDAEADRGSVQSLSHFGLA